MLSTLYYLFKGEKELFVDTWIYDKWNWEVYPVVRVSFASGRFENEQKLRNKLDMVLHSHGKYYGIEYEYTEPDERFAELLSKLHEKYDKPVVILIDEYEKPVLDNITNPMKAKEMRELLRGFYSVLKDCAGVIRFLLITGLTKFTKMGVFSALNNLNDISFDEKYSQMLGYTDDEILTYFDDYINRSLAVLTKYDRETLLHEIKNY